MLFGKIFLRNSGDTTSRQRGTHRREVRKPQRNSRVFSLHYELCNKDTEKQSKHLVVLLSGTVAEEDVEPNYGCLLHCWANPSGRAVLRRGFATDYLLVLRVRIPLGAFCVLCVVQ